MGGKSSKASQSKSESGVKREDEAGLIKAENVTPVKAEKPSDEPVVQPVVQPVVKPQDTPATQPATQPAVTGSNVNNNKQTVEDKEKGGSKKFKIPSLKKSKSQEEKSSNMSATAQYVVGNKVFTGEQVARYRKVFNMFDINKDGVLEARELAAVSRVLGYRLPKQQVFSILQHFDLDANSKLNFDEFLLAMPGNLNFISDEEHKRAEIRLRFQEFDRDDNGFISRQEAHGVLKQELGFTESQTISLMKQFDINADGMLSYEEFVGFYMKVVDRKEAIDKAFKQFDRDNKGYVTVDDAKRILAGMLFSEREVEALVHAHDTNRDGCLQYEEFMHFWTA